MDQQSISNTLSTVQRPEQPQRHAMDFAKTQNGIRSLWTPVNKLKSNKKMESFFVNSAVSPQMPTLATPSVLVIPQLVAHSRKVRSVGDPGSTLVSASAPLAVARMSSCSWTRLKCIEPKYWQSLKLSQSGMSSARYGSGYGDCFVMLRNSAREMFFRDAPDAPARDHSRTSGPIGCCKL